jgi:hypothetical protein
MLIDHRGRLRAAVAIRAVEIEGGDAMLAESAFEFGAAADRCGYVISHTVTVPLLPVLFWDKRCATLEQDPLSAARRSPDNCSRCRRRSNRVLLSP